MNAEQILTHTEFDPEDFIKYVAISRANATILGQLIYEFPLLLNIKIHNELIGNFFPELYSDVMRLLFRKEEFDVAYLLIREFENLNRSQILVIGKYINPILIDRLVEEGLCNNHAKCMILLDGYMRNQTPFTSIRLADNTIEHFWNLMHHDPMAHYILASIIPEKQADRLYKMALNNAPIMFKCASYPAIRKMRSSDIRLKLFTDLVQIKSQGSNEVAKFIKKITKITKPVKCPLGCNKIIKSWPGLSSHLKFKHRIITEKTVWLSKCHINEISNLYSTITTDDQ